MSLAPSLRILCAEDDPALRHALATGLSRFGCEIVTAQNGVEALTQYLAHKGRFEAIISDHSMPQMNGLRFLRAVRDAGYRGRIVLMSGNLATEELRAYEPLQISGFFHKPFDVTLLATMLLQNKSSVHENEQEGLPQAE